MARVATLIVVVIALAKFFAINALFGAVGVRWEELSLIAHVQRDLASIQLRWDDPSIYWRLRQQISDEIGALSEAGHVSEANEIREAYGEWVDARAKNVTSDPQYKVLQGKIASLEIEIRDEAQQWRGYALWLTGATLLVASTLIGALILQSSRRVIRLVATENRERELQASERRFRSLVQSSADVIVVADVDGRLTLVSDADSSLWGSETEGGLGHSIFENVHPDDDAHLRQVFEVSRTSGERELETQVRVLSVGGEYRPQSVRLVNMVKEAEISGIVLTYRDVTERVQFEEQLRYHALHDRLTGLPNRWLFIDRLDHRLSVLPERSAVCIMFLDLDNFKVINDSLGHEAGDRLLVKVAERLQTVVGPSDTVARIGGDEFTVLLVDVETESDAASMAQRVLAGFAAPIPLGERDVVITASIGIALGSSRGSDSHGLLRDADTAMYHAKARGKASYAVFDRSMKELAVERFEVEHELRAAMDANQFIVHYQPIVDMTLGHTRGVEALVRWQHPERGLVPPNAFIPIAEEIGIICRIGAWVLRRVCEQLSEWDRAASTFAGVSASVNVSAKQIAQEGFADSVAETLREYQIDPRRIELEITETAMLGDLERSQAVFQELRAFGVRIAIDDFGTGYSSMAYLGRLSVDTLKIDRSFVSLLGDDPKSEGMVRAIIGMARALGLETISEGIESVDQLRRLRSLGCHSGQGYLFARPQSAPMLQAPEAQAMLDSGYEFVAQVV